MRGYSPRRQGAASSRAPCRCHEPPRALARARAVADRVRPNRPPEVEPILLGAQSGSRCRPFLRVEKDPHAFAACNALADEIGPLDDPEKAFELIESVVGAEVNEVFGIVTLDLHSRMKSIAETGRGEPASVMAPMVPTLQAALIDGAYAVIIFHVHPSGVLAEPSDADKETTEAFAEAFDTVGVHLLDHIIVGGDHKRRSYYSFAEARAL